MSRRDAACELAEAGKFDEAITQFREHLAEDSGDAVAFDELAQCLSEVGDFEAGFEAACHATDIDGQVSSLPFLNIEDVDLINQLNLCLSCLSPEVVSHIN